MKIGYIGLGKMGKNMVFRLLEQRIDVVAWNRSPQPMVEVGASGANTSSDIIHLISQLEAPRIIWLMLPAGDVTDQIIDILIPLLSPHDLIIDGANSFYKDTLKRGQLLSQHSIRFMDIGVSGGPDGARNGACLMVGGTSEDYQYILPVIKAASAPQAFGHFGPLGSGHFAKMVHNGIEYGMMQAIAEGAAVLKNSSFDLDLVEIFRVYGLGSVISSRLVDWTREALEDDINLVNISAKINASGEGEWTVKTAHELGIEVPIIEKSLDIRTASQTESSDSPNSFRNKVVSAQRGKFGHHPVTKSEEV
ncbi:MAG: decarboxylating 6-phosphogluconate dehydrogenase [Microgenomates group bacterium]